MLLSGRSHTTTAHGMSGSPGRAPLSVSSGTLGSDPEVAPVDDGKMGSVDQTRQVVPSCGEEVVDHGVRRRCLAVAVMPCKVEEVEDLHDSADLAGELCLHPGQLLLPSRLSSDHHVRSLRARTAA